MGSVNAERFVRLTDQDRSEMAKQMARHWTRVEALRAQKAEEAKRTQGEIDEELDEIGRICRVINDDGENRNQLDLFADQNLATEALALLYRRAECSDIEARSCPVHGECSCEPAEGEAAYDGKAPAVKAVSCPLHGVDAPHAKDAPPVPVQSEADVMAARVQKLADDFAATLPEDYDGNTHETNRRFREWWKVQAKDAAEGVSKGDVRKAIIATVNAQPLAPAGAGATDAPAEEPEESQPEA